MQSRDWSSDMEQIQPHSEHNNSALLKSMLFGCLIIRLRCDALLSTATLPEFLPGVDEVLGDADAGRRACDRDLAHGWTISGTGNFDVSSRDLANLIDLTALSSNYAANKLEKGRMETC